MNAREKKLFGISQNSNSFLQFSMNLKTTSADKLVRSLSMSLLVSLKRKAFFSNLCSKRTATAFFRKFNVIGDMKTNKKLLREHGTFTKISTTNR